VEALAAPASDEALVSRAAAGDEAAFEELVRRHQERVYRLACRLTGDDADAADVLQETFLQVFRHLGEFRGEARFATWLFRVVTNAALMRRRTRARRPADSLEAYMPRFDAEGRHAATPAQLQVTSQVEELLDRETLAARASAGLARLPEACRDAFVLRDLEELSTAEVASVLEITPAAVRQRVHRARLLLRGYLNDLAEGRG
jgi:RNA polymerase sigma-70 factor (ECF subfamily)